MIFYFLNLEDGTSKETISIFVWNYVIAAIVWLIIGLYSYLRLMGWEHKKINNRVLENLFWIIYVIGGFHVILPFFALIVLVPTLTLISNIIYNLCSNHSTTDCTVEPIEGVLRSLDMKLQVEYKSGTGKGLGDTAAGDKVPPLEDYRI
jgi:hypothetical protein